MKVLVARSQRRVRHWAYDVARYFHVDPTTVLRAWSVGDVVEAMYAIETYEAVQEAQAAVAERRQKAASAAKGRRAPGAWQ